MATIICDEKEFIFIHIPKCAGSSVSAQLWRLVKWDEFFVGRPLYDHPEAGKLMRAHLPLAVLDQYFPETLEKYMLYDTYAVTRDPTSRFISSVAEHLRAFKNVHLLETPPDELARTVDDAMSQMLKTPILPPVEYIHFTRQSDYIELDGKQIVKNTYRVETVDEMAEDIARRHNVPLVTASFHQNATTAYKSNLVKTLMHTGGTLGRNFLPKKQYQKLRGWTRSKATIPSSHRKSDIFYSDTVQDFVSDFYKRDFELWKDALKS